MADPSPQEAADPLGPTDEEVAQANEEAKAGALMEEATDVALARQQEAFENAGLRGLETPGGASLLIDYGSNIPEIEMWDPALVTGTKAERREKWIERFNAIQEDQDKQVMERIGETPGLQKTFEKYMPIGTGVMGAGVGIVGGLPGMAAGAALGTGLGVLGRGTASASIDAVRDYGKLWGSWYTNAHSSAAHTPYDAPDLDPGVPEKEETVEVGLNVPVPNPKLLDPLTDAAVTLATHVPSRAFSPASRAKEGSLEDSTTVWPFKWGKLRADIPKKAWEEFTKSNTFERGTRFHLGTQSAGRTTGNVKDAVSYYLGRAGRARVGLVGSKLTYPTNRDEYDYVEGLKKRGLSKDAVALALRDFRDQYKGGDWGLTIEEEKIEALRDLTPEEAKDRLEGISQEEQEKLKKDEPDYLKHLKLRAMGRGWSSETEGYWGFQSWEYTEEDKKREDEMKARMKEREDRFGESREQAMEALERENPNLFAKMTFEENLEAELATQDSMAVLNKEQAEGLIGIILKMPEEDRRKWIDMVKARKGGNDFTPEGIIQFIVNDLPLIQKEMPEEWIENGIALIIRDLWSARWSTLGQPVALPEEAEAEVERLENGDIVDKILLEELAKVMEAESWQAFVRNQGEEVEARKAGKPGLYGHADVSTSEWAQNMRIKLANPGKFYSGPYYRMQDYYRYLLGDPAAMLDLQAPYTRLTGPGKTGLNASKIRHKLIQSRFDRLAADNAEDLATMTEVEKFEATKVLQERAEIWAGDKLLAIYNMGRGKVLLWKDSQDTWLMNNPNLPGPMKALAAVMLPIAAHEQPYWGKMHIETESPLAYLTRAGFPLSALFGAWVRGQEHAAPSQSVHVPMHTLSVGLERIGESIPEMWSQPSLTYLRTGGSLIFNPEIGVNMDNTIRAAHEMVTGNKPPPSRTIRQASHILLAMPVVFMEPSVIGLGLGSIGKISEMGNAFVKTRSLNKWAKVVRDADKFEDPLEAVAFLNKELENAAITGTYNLNVHRKLGFNESAKADLEIIRNEYIQAIKDEERLTAEILDTKSRIGVLEHTRGTTVIKGGTPEEVALVQQKALAEAKYRVAKARIAEAVIIEAEAAAELEQLSKIYLQYLKDMPLEDLPLSVKSWKSPFTRRWNPEKQNPFDLERGVSLKAVDEDLDTVTLAIEKQIDGADINKKKNVPELIRAQQIAQDIATRSAEIRASRQRLIDLGASVVTPARKTKKTKASDAASGAMPPKATQPESYYAKEAIKRKKAAAREEADAFRRANKKKEKAIEKERTKLRILIKGSKNKTGLSKYLRDWDKAMKNLDPAFAEAAKRYRNIRGLKDAQIRLSNYRAIIEQSEVLNEARAGVLSAFNAAKKDLQVAINLRKDVPGLAKPKAGTVALKLKTAETSLAQARVKIARQKAVTKASRESLDEIATSLEKAAAEIKRKPSIVRGGSIDAPAALKAYAPPGVGQSLSQWVGRVAEGREGKVARWLAKALRSPDVTLMANGFKKRGLLVDQLLAEERLSGVEVESVMELADARAVAWGSQYKRNPLVWYDEKGPRLVIRSFDAPDEGRSYLRAELDMLDESDYLFSMKKRNERYAFRSGKFSGAPRVRGINYKGLSPRDARQRFYDTPVRGPSPGKRINAKGEEKDILGPILGEPMRKEKDLDALRNRLINFTEAGIDSRFWYREAGKGILEMASGDIPLARRIAAVISELSPQKSVRENVLQAVRAIQAMDKGENPQHLITILNQASKTRTGTLQKVINAYERGEALGPKVGAFKDDLLRYIDPEVVSDMPTIDTWVMKAFGYAGGSPDPGQQKFIKRIIEDIRDHLNKKVKHGEEEWSNDQVQAAMWVATRDLDPRYASQSNYDIVDGMKDTGLWMTLESKPGSNTDHLQELFKADWRKQLEFHAEVMSILKTPEGRDVLALELGPLPIQRIGTLGLYQGDYSPGSAVILALGRSTGDDQHILTKEGHALANMYAVANAILLRQKALAWHTRYQRAGLSKGKSNGIRLDLKERTPTHEELDDLSKALVDQYGTKAAQSIAVVGTPDGVHLLNLEYEGIKNLDFQRDVNAIANRVFGERITNPIEKRNFRSQTGYKENDWRANPNGEDFLKWLEEGDGDKFKGHGREAREAVERVLRRYDPSIVAAQKRIADREGWTFNQALGERWRAKGGEQALTEAAPISTPKTLLQSEEGTIKGATVFPEGVGSDAQKIIYLFKYKDPSNPGFDVSTVLHELGHVFRRDLIGEEKKAVETWIGKTLKKTGRAAEKDAQGNFVWNREAEELFVDAWLVWLQKGKAPTKSLQGAFHYFSRWLKGVYQTVEDNFQLDPSIENAFADLLQLKRHPDDMGRILDQAKFSKSLDERYGRATVMKFIEEVGGPEGRIIEEATGREPSVITLRGEYVAAPESYGLNKRYLTDADIDEMLDAPSRIFDADNPGAAEWRAAAAAGLRARMMDGTTTGVIPPYPWKGKDLSGEAVDVVEDVLASWTPSDLTMIREKGKRNTWGRDRPQIEGGVVMPATQGTALLKPARAFKAEPLSPARTSKLQDAVEMLSNFAKSHMAQEAGLLPAKAIDRQIKAMIGPYGGGTSITAAVKQPIRNFIRKFRPVFHPDVSNYSEYSKLVYDAMKQVDNMLDRTSKDVIDITTWSRNPIDTLIRYVSTTDAIEINRYKAGSSEFATGATKALATARTVARPSVIEYTWMNVSDQDMFTQFRRWALGLMADEAGIAELKDSKILNGLARAFLPRSGPAIPDAAIATMKDTIINALRQDIDFRSLQRTIYFQANKPSSKGGFGEASGYAAKINESYLINRRGGTVPFDEAAKLKDRSHLEIVDPRSTAQMIDIVTSGAIMFRFNRIFRRAVGGNITAKNAENVTKYLSGLVGEIKTQKEYEEVFLTLERLGMPARNRLAKGKIGLKSVDLIKDLRALDRSVETSVFIPRHLFDVVEGKMDKFVRQLNAYHAVAPTIAEVFPSLRSVSPSALGRAAKINMTVGVGVLRPWYMVNDYAGNNAQLFQRMGVAETARQSSRNLPGYLPVYGKYATLAMSRMAEETRKNVPILRPMVEALFDPDLQAIWSGRKGFMQSSTTTPRVMSYSEARERLMQVAIETQVSEELLQGVSRWTRANPLLAKSDDSWKAWVSSLGPKGKRGLSNMQGDIYDHVQWAQQQQRAMLWLDIWRRTGDTAQADKAVKDAFYSWKHGFAQMEAGFLAQFNIPFYRWWRLAWWQANMALMEPFVKPSGAYMKKALYSGNEIDQYRKQIMLMHGIPYWYQEDYKVQSDTTRTALDDLIAMRVPKWMRGGTYPFIHRPISNERMMWEMAHGRPAFTDIAQAWSPMSAIDTMRVALMPAVISGTLAVYMAKMVSEGKDPAVIPADFYEAGIIDPIMSFTGPFVQTIVEPAFRQHLDPLATKIYPRKRMSNEEVITWKFISQNLLPGNMMPNQDKDGYYVQNPLTVLMLRLFIPQYGSNLPLAIRTLYDSPVAEQGMDAQMIYGLKRLFRWGVEYPYNPNLEFARDIDRMSKMAEHLAEQQEAATTKPQPGFR